MTEKQYFDFKSDECITWAIRFFLGREPKNENEILLHKKHGTFESLRTGFCQTTEFQSFFRSKNSSFNKYKVPLFLLPPVDNGNLTSTFKSLFSPPTLSHISSQLCTHDQFSEPIYHNWCNELKIKPTFHRKQWEFVWILEAMKKAGVIKNASRALGFGTGTEPIPSLLAKYGLNITASDAPENLQITQGWAKTNQYSSNVKDLFKSSIIDEATFERNVSWRPIDMNNIPADLIDYDVCWSACAFEHLGSLKKVMEFLESSLKTLRPGGYSIHTTEFNLTSNYETIETEGLSIFRKSDFEDIQNKLTSEGHYVWPINFHPGSTELDEVIDTPPFSLPHLKLEIQKFTCTSIGIVIKKAV